MHEICCKITKAQAVNLIEIEAFAGSTKGDHNTKETFGEKFQTATVRPVAYVIMKRHTNNIG